MTLDDIRSRVAELATFDDEIAHSAEDGLRDEVLRAIADGEPNAADLAREVLKSADVEFSRWYA